MKTFFDHTWRILVATIALYIIWITSMAIAESIITSGLKTPEGAETRSAVLLLVICLIHVIILYIMLLSTKWRGIRITIVVFLLLFFIQYFLSMVEALWFNNALDMPVSGIKNILLSGFIMSFIFSPLLVLISGKMTKGKDILAPGINWTEIISIPFLIKTLILIVVFYPVIYNLAGYYIAWQFEAVRIFYTDSSDIEPFGYMLLENIKSGLYAFQIIRGFLWLMLALPVFYMVDGSYVKKGIIIGLLFAALMNVQHMLPNPYFPREVSFAHFIETFLSNFLWGFSIAWIINWQPKRRFSRTS
jgi:hypothetical protein